MRNKASGELPFAVLSSPFFCCGSPVSPATLTHFKLEGGASDVFVCGAVLPCGIKDFVVGFAMYIPL